MNSLSPISNPDPDRAALDEELCQRIRLFLRTLRRAFLRQIQVEVSNGVVTIEGAARSYHERQLAVACVRRVAGVRQVMDLIVVLQDSKKPDRGIVFSRQTKV